MTQASRRSRAAWPVLAICALLGLLPNWLASGAASTSLSASVAAPALIAQSGARSESADVAAAPATPDTSVTTIWISSLLDQRVAAHDLPLARLSSTLNAAFGQEGFTVTTSPTDVGYEVQLTVEYFGTVKSGSGKHIGKAYADVLIKDLCSQAIILRTRCVADFPMKLKGSKEKKTRQAADLLSEALAQRVVEAASVAIGQHNSPCRWVTAEAEAPLTATKKDCVEIATLNAMRSACEQAFGLNIFAETTVRDLGDVEDIVQARGAGRVLRYELLDTRVSPDSLSCIVTARFLLMRDN